MCFVGLLDNANAGILKKTYEIACTGGNVNPLGNFLTARGQQFKWGSGIPHGTRVNFDPKTNEVKIKFLTVTGAVGKEITLTQN